MDEPPSQRSNDREYIWRVLVALGFAAMAVTAWMAIEVLLLVFGGLLLAVFLRALAMPLAERSPLSPSVALTVVLFVILGLFGLAGTAVAPEFAEQADEVRQALPQLVEQVQGLLETVGLSTPGQGESMQVQEVGGDLIQWVGAFLGGIAHVTAYILTVLFVGLFVAYNPSLYIGGLLRLTPVDHRETMHDLIDALGHTLRWWLIGRALAMVLVGLSTWLLLTILGVPLALLVGCMTGLFTFIPYLGPVLGMVPVTLAGLLEDPTIALYALGIYFIIENIEGYALDPLIQQRMVYLPSAITVAVQIGMGLLIGPIGIALATPLAAVAMVTIQKTYVARLED